jgi:hypothetical protein
MSVEEDVSDGPVGQTEDLADDFKHPKLKEGFVFRKTIPEFTIEENGRDVSVALTVATSPAQEGEASILYIELTRESDIYYVASSELHQDGFPEFRRTQKLRKSQGFLAFIEDLLKILDNVTSNRTTFRAIYTGTSLEFRQQLEFKNVKLFALNFTVLDRTDPYVKNQAQFRYAWLNHRLSEREHLLSDLLEHVRGKNPQLAQQLEKGSKFAQKLR